MKGVIYHSLCYTSIILSSEATLQSEMFQRQRSVHLSVCQKSDFFSVSIQERQLIVLEKITLTNEHLLFNYFCRLSVGWAVQFRYSRVHSPLLNHNRNPSNNFIKKIISLQQGCISAAVNKSSFYQEAAAAVVEFERRLATIVLLFCDKRKGRRI